MTISQGPVVTVHVAKPRTTDITKVVQLSDEIDTVLELESLSDTRIKSLLARALGALRQMALELRKARGEQ